MYGHRTTFIPLTYGKISLIHVHFEVVFAKIPRHFPYFSKFQIFKIGKIHRKLKINKRQYCFANISATKAPILMKLRTSIHKIVKNHPQIFRKDPCIHTRTWDLNVPRAFCRDETRVRTFSPHVRAGVHGSLRKICGWFFTILWIEISNFIKIGAFVAEIFAKQYWRLFNPYFSMYFPYFQNLSLKVSEI